MHIMSSIVCVCRIDVSTERVKKKKKDYDLAEHSSI